MSGETYGAGLPWFHAATTGTPLITTRTLDQAKAEIQRRADRALPPVGGVPPDDVREALAAIASFERDEWALAFARLADRHLERAQAVEATAPADARREYWLAWRIFNFARWPVENTPVKRFIYPRALAAFRNYGRLLDPPLEMVRIPFGSEVITGYLRVPAGPRPAPLVLGISGLDSRKEDVCAHSDAYLAAGLAVLALDMPGTGEAPEPLTADGGTMFSRTLDYIATRSDLDASRVVVQGRSWSGYWAAKLAVTERERLRGTVVHGGPIHGYFQPDWLGPSIDTLEYLYDYLPAKEALFGVTGREALLAHAPSLSLDALGILDRPSAPMLVVNGAQDSQIPIADAWRLLDGPGTRDAWINPDGHHMGRSPEWPAKRIFEEVLLPWMRERLDA